MPVIVGTEFADLNLVGGASDDFISGLGGNDTLDGLGGSNRLYGGLGNDLLFGTFGSYNYLYGEDGDDRFVLTRNSSNPTNFVDGGLGFDTVSYSSSIRIGFSGVTVDLAAGTARTSITGGVDRLTGIEGVEGSSYSDIISGDDHRNVFSHGTFVLNGTVDQYDGRGGSDRYVASGSLGIAGQAQLPADTAASLGSIIPLEIAYGARASFLANLYGLSANQYNSSDGIALYSLWDDKNSNGRYETGELVRALDILRNINEYSGSNLGDTITGSIQNEVIAGGAGLNTLDGGGGIDFVSYADVDVGTGNILQIVNLNSGANAFVTNSDGSFNFGGILQDTLSGFEGVIGSNGRDDITVGTVSTGNGVGYTAFGLGGDDAIRGAFGDDVLYGGDGNDFLVGNFSNFNPQEERTFILGFVNGKSALIETDRDVLTGGKGSDILDGMNGFDTASYRDSEAAVVVDLLRGEGGGAVNSDSYGDHLFNIEGVVGSRYDDLIRGSDGNNVIEGRDGADTLYGCDGDDIIFGEADAASRVPLGTGNLRPDIETNADICGPDCDPSLPVGQIYNASFDDEIHGGCGNDTIYGQAGADELYGDEGNDILDGGDGIDCLMGGDGQDVLRGGLSTDFVMGGAGDDVLDGGAGFDLIDGGIGRDTVDYVGSNAGVTIDLNAWWHNAGGDASQDLIDGVVSLLKGEDDCVNAAQSGVFSSLMAGFGATNSTTNAATFLLPDVILNVENVWGSNFNDVITGNADDNSLNGRDGSDILIGGDGYDELIGGAGADVLIGGNGIDTATYVTATTGLTLDVAGGVSTGDAAGDSFSSIEILKLTNFADVFQGGNGGDFVGLGNGNDVAMGEGGNDSLFGEGGEDLLVGGAGNDLLHGGAGYDTVFYFGATGGVSVDLAAGNAYAFYGNSGVDTLIDIEAVRGGNFGDQLVGNSMGNVLDGGDGNDALYGALGADILNGGGGADRFVYVNQIESSFTVADTLIDFQSGVDKIDISAARGGRSMSFALNPGANGVKYLDIDFSQDGTIDMHFTLTPGTLVLASDLVL